MGSDFPTLSEPHGSFTPLFTSQPEQLAFSKSVSLRLHISASCPVFLFSVVFFFCSPHLNSSPAVQISCTAVLSWSSGSLDAADRISAYSGETSFSAPQPTTSGSLLTCGAVVGALIKRQHLLLFFPPALSETPCFSFSQPVESHPVPLAVSLTFFSPFSSFFSLLDKRFRTVHWQILYKIAI